MAIGQNDVPDLCFTGGNGAISYNMGMGKLGDSETELKRKFRWVMAIEFCKINGVFTKVVPAHFCKIASRPDLSIEETELNFLNSKTWISGKPSFEQISVTYLDVATDDNIGLWEWIGTVYNFFTPPGGGLPCYQMGRRTAYEGQSTLQLLDGCGFPVEEWEMKNMWPTSIKFGELDYSQSETVDIELQLRYSNVTYLNYCGRQPAPCTCENICGGTVLGDRI